MNTKLTIKNFRVFDESGVSIDINPITILTGSNSSGKSSAVKAVFLLNSFLSQIKKDYDNDDKIQLDKYKLDFTQFPINLLGRFDKVVNRASSVKAITIEYSVYSLMLSRDVNIQLVFSSDSNDELNNAYLESMSMSTENGIFFSTSNDQDSYCNLNLLRKDYRTFLLTEFLIHKYCAIESRYELEDNYSSINNKNQTRFIKDYLVKNDDYRRRDILRYVRITKRNNSIIQENKVDPTAIEQIDDNGSIFLIPILDYISELKKDEVEQFINSSILGITNGRLNFDSNTNSSSSENANKALIFATKKVLTAFKESSYDTFNDFFFYYEKLFLEHVTLMSNPLGTLKKSIRMLSSDELSLVQDYLFDNPYNVHYGIFSSGRVDEDSKLSEFLENKNTLNMQKAERIKKWENTALTFEILYEVVMEWNRRYSEEDTSSYVYIPTSSEGFGTVYHVAYQLLTKFAEILVKEIICPNWCGNMSFVNSTRAIVKRLYPLDGKDDLSLLLHKYLENKRNYLNSQNHNSFRNKRNYVIDSFMNQWIKRFEIGKSISLQTDKEGLGVQIRLKKGSDKKEILLADEGYGMTQLISILLQIETAILSAQGEKVNLFYSLDDLDHYETDKFHYEINTIAIEEPEIHLHPKFQSLLADMFIEAYKLYNIHFIIETHSEYLIRKFQTFVARKEVEADKISLNYVFSPEDYVSPSDSRVKHISINEDGSLSDSFGTGFYDEADNLSVELMSLKMRKS